MVVVMVIYLLRGLLALFQLYEITKIYLPAFLYNMYSYRYFQQGHLALRSDARGIYIDEFYIS